MGNHPLNSLVILKGDSPCKSQNQRYVIRLVKHLVNVNCLAPGDTRTGRFLGTREVPQERLATAGTLNRIALVDEVARVVDFFAGPLGDFVTGQVLRVDGGSQIWTA